MLVPLLLAAAMVLAAADAKIPPGPFTDPEIAAALGRLEGAPGAWAEYLVRANGKGDLRVRATALASGAAQKFWLELATASESGIMSAARMLIDATSPERRVERAYVRVAGQQPIEVPAEGMQAGGAATPGAGAGVKRLGTERIRVPAGEFAADVTRSSGTRVWTSVRVPLWGLVKAQSSKRSVELVAFGAHGGKSSFPPGWDQGNGSESRK